MTRERCADGAGGRSPGAGGPASRVREASAIPSAPGGADSLAASQSPDGPGHEAIQRIGMEALDACAELFVAAFNGPPWHDAWRPEQARAYLEDVFRSPGFMGFLLSVADRPVAFCVGRVNRWYRGDEYMVHEFGVHPDAQRRGYGTRLLAAVESAVAAAGCHAIVLLTRRDMPAAAFYAAHGFSLSPRLALFYKALT